MNGDKSKVVVPSSDKPSSFMITTSNTTKAPTIIVLKFETHGDKRTSVAAKFRKGQLKEGDTNFPVNYSKLDNSTYVAKTKEPLPKGEYAILLEFHMVLEMDTPQEYYTFRVE